MGSFVTDDDKIIFEFRVVRHDAIAVAERDKASVIKQIGVESDRQVEHFFYKGVARIFRRKRSIIKADGAFTLFKFFPLGIPTINDGAILRIFSSGSKVRVGSASITVYSLRLKFQEGTPCGFFREVSGFA